MWGTWTVACIRPWGFPPRGLELDGAARGDRFKRRRVPLLSSAAADLLPPPRRLRRSYRRRGRQGEGIVHPAEVLVELERRHRAGDVIQRAFRVDRAQDAAGFGGEDHLVPTDGSVDVEARDVDVGAGDVPRGAPVGKLDWEGRDARSGDGGG